MENTTNPATIFNFEIGDEVQYDTAIGTQIGLFLEYTHNGIMVRTRKSTVEINYAMILGKK
jgi:hypothetical protein